jgi:hypothetical protein
MIIELSRSVAHQGSDIQFCNLLLSTGTGIIDDKNGKEPKGLLV